MIYWIVPLISVLGSETGSVPRKGMWRWEGKQVVIPRSLHALHGGSLWTLKCVREEVGEDPVDVNEMELVGVGEWYVIGTGNNGSRSVFIVQTVDCVDEIQIPNLYCFIITDS